MPTTWLFSKESLSVGMYLQSLEKLNRIKGRYNVLYPGHGDPVDVAVLDELKECCKQILSGKCKAEPYHSITGEDAVSCTYKTVTIAYDSAKIK